MGNELNYDNDGLDLPEEYFKKQEQDNDDIYFPPEESEPSHY